MGGQTRIRKSARKFTHVVKVVIFTHIQLTCNQLVSTVVWVAKRWKTCVALAYEFELDQSQCKWVAKRNAASTCESVWPGLNVKVTKFKMWDAKWADNITVIIKPLVRSRKRHQLLSSWTLECSEHQEQTASTAPQVRRPAVPCTAKVLNRGVLCMNPKLGRYQEACTQAKDAHQVLPSRLQTCQKEHSDKGWARIIVCRRGDRISHPRAIRRHLMRRTVLQWNRFVYLRTERKQRREGWRSVYWRIMRKIKKGKTCSH